MAKRESLTRAFWILLLLLFSAFFVIETPLLLWTYRYIMSNSELLLQKEQLAFLPDTKGSVSSIAAAANASVTADFSNASYHQRFTRDIPWETILTYESPLHDKTLFYDNSVDRIWMRHSENTQQNDKESFLPPIMLLLTNYVWNQPNQWEARKDGRSVKQRHFLEAVINHPWFHPHGFELLQQNTLKVPNGTTLLLFLDYETCCEKNYPHYGNRTENMDRVGSRGRRMGDNSRVEFLKDALRLVDKQQQLERMAKVIILDCEYSARTASKLYWRRSNTKDERIILFSMNAHTSSHSFSLDMGMPPASIVRCDLTNQQARNVHDCNDSSRPFLLTFSGNFRHATRQSLRLLHNGKDVIVGEPSETSILMKGDSTNNTTQAFLNLALQSRFAAVPRGDCLYSYRFTEVMSCGAIPVIYADGWVLPFDRAVMDPKDYAVILPESHINQTLAILANIPPQKQCEMRRNVLEFYNKYLRGHTEILQGLIESLQVRINNL